MNRHTIEALSSSDTNPLVTSIVETLRAIDFEHQMELNRLQDSDTSPEIKWLVSERLKAKHRERREPYVQGLAKLSRQRPACAKDHAPERPDRLPQPCVPDPLEPAPA